MQMRRGLGIDLGTANTLVYLRGTGIVVDEPSVVAVEETSGKVLAVGAEAKEMIGRTPDGIKAIRPMRDGVIADFDTTREMVRYFIKKVTKSVFGFKPELIICGPFGMTEVEKRALIEVALRCGCSENSTYLIDEPMAAAMGAGLPVEDPVGSMVVDIGGGTTEVAVISLGGIAASRSLKTAGDAFDDAIETYIKKTSRIFIGERTAEDIKIAIGTAYVDDDTQEESMTIKGRDILTGLPKTIEITNFQVAEALYDPVMKIVEAVVTTLEDTPPELSADIYDHGIYLTGGGALLRGMDIMIRKNTGLPVTIADDPLDCVVNGTGKVLEDPDRFGNTLTAAKLREE
jgi:rod shape-determining protein MreB